MQLQELRRVLDTRTPDDVMLVGFDEVDVEDAEYAKLDAKAY